MKTSSSRKQEYLEVWKEKARSEFRGSDLCDLDWNTPEGIKLKALYTASDLEKLEWIDSLPGLFPFIRGPKASMYAGRPWTIRQYAGFSTAEESNRFYKENFRPA